MDTEIIIIDQAYKYEVEEILPGSIGYARLMSMLEYSRKPPDTGGLAYFECAGEKSKYPYRNQLAAKTMKNPDHMERFDRECESWLELNMPGVVPLLKVVNSGSEKLALMPCYTGNLRSLMRSNYYPPVNLLQALQRVISGMSIAYDKYSVVHQGVKPENILYCYGNKKLVLELSDWGIANVQAGLLPDTEGRRNKLLNKFGILPYLAPERFENYLADVPADIFSLGMICFEIVTGSQPFEVEKNMAEQIISGEYYERAQTILSRFPDAEIKDMLLRMIHPTIDKRTQDYGALSKMIAA